MIVIIVPQAVFIGVPLFSLFCQTCLSSAFIPDMMTSTWSYVATAVRWWSRRPLRSTARGGMALWPSSTPGCGPPPRPPSPSRDPTMDTRLPTGPIPPPLHPGRGEDRVWGLYERLRPHLLPHLSTDTPRTPKMVSGKKGVGRWRGGFT